MERPMCGGGTEKKALRDPESLLFAATTITCALQAPPPSW
jgi:hypothetical protein